MVERKIECYEFVWEWDDIDHSDLLLEMNIRLYFTDEIVLQFSDFKDKNAEFVSDIRDIIVAFFSPYRKLFCNFFPLTRNL